MIGMSAIASAASRSFANCLGTMSPVGTRCARPGRPQVGPTLHDSRRRCTLRIRWFAFFTWALTVAAASPAALSDPFDSANRLYEQGKFPEAASAYEGLIRSGPVSPALYFNLGNAWFKSGQTGRAIAAYRRAERIAPRDPDLRANLQFVRNQVQGPTLLPDRWERGLSRLTVNEWTVLASVALWAWLLLLAVAQLRPGLKASLRTWAFSSGIAAAALSACLAAALLGNTNSTAIVIAHDAAARSGPVEESQPAFTVNDGAELKVMDRKDNWLQVRAGDRRLGWLKQEQVTVL